MKRTLIFAAALAVAACGHHRADSLADMGIAVDPELVAGGIEPGERHAAIPPQFAAASPAFVPVDPLLQLGAALGRVPGAPANAQGPIVLLGDSIMAGVGSAPGIVNLAVGGTTTAEILGSVALIPPGTREVIIEGGINDGLGNPNAGGRIVNNYAEMLRRVPPGITVKIFGIFPVNETQDRTVTNATIANVDAHLREICTGRCSFQPSPFGASLPAALNRGDGLHPNAQGTAVIRAAIH